MGSAPQRGANMRMRASTARAETLGDAVRAKLSQQLLIRQAPAIVVATTFEVVAQVSVCASLET